MRVDLSTMAEELAAQVREARLKANLTQDELARKMKVSLRTIQNWEAGHLPAATHRRKLARFFEGQGSR